MIVQQMEQPFCVIPPKGNRQSQVIAASPHSGRKYLSHFIHQSNLSLQELRKVEDAGMDRLLTFQPLPSALILAEFPRSFVDLNRHPDEIDHLMFDNPVHFANKSVTRYLRSGLGVIPSKAANQQDIYTDSLPAAEADFRLGQFYRPYHQELEKLITMARTQGHALLIDCHSMPSGLFGIHSDVIIGSNHGQSTLNWIVNEAQAYFTREGMTVKLNAPFAGGYITRHYGQPDNGVSALQIEICRSLYLDETNQTLKDGWQETASILTRFIMRMDEMMSRYKNG
ncbi:N-formylglutamate amidohydrolase [Alphaproteobacteria bacterium LSUCC0684]